MAEPCRKILCIDDEREAAALIAEELVDRGFEVWVAHDGHEGFAAINRYTSPEYYASARLVDEAFARRAI